ncbi:MAG: mechanosensitive ion channel family protein [Cellulomonadaceae bacterium]|jgi:small conductance mechanosensitive channel|nr:mechanosensitive ion channel family protein [Cellulomonadaceae bacterium]
MGMAMAASRDWNWSWFSSWPLHVLAILAGGLLTLALVRRLIHILTERIALGYYRAYADAVDEEVEEGTGLSLAAKAAGLDTTAIRVIKPGLRPIPLVESAMSVDGSGDVTPEVQRRRALRARTVGSVLQSAANIIIIVTMVMMILGAVGADEIVTPLLASAGVLGVALGFGAQSLVRDFLSGIFILIEDQFGVGDRVDLGGNAVGVVEKMDLRLTHVRAFNGTLWHVRNGEIIRAGNQTQQWARAVAEIQVPAGSDRGAVRAALGRAIDSIAADPQWYPLLLETPSLRGIDSITNGFYMFTLHGKVRPGSDLEISRALREEAQKELTGAGIRLDPRINV